jgi:HCOMODA/2-hydroxy-3-carboxy-muconic semialdehyde decarboxylase
MLSSEEFAVLDAYGHVSIRSQSDPNRFLIARAVAPALVTAADIYESDMEGNPVSGDAANLIEERFIHSEIYKAKPEINAIVYTGAPQIVAYSVSSVPLGNNQVFDIRKAAGGQNGLVSTPALGRALVESMGARNVTLILGSGAVIASNEANGAVRGALGLRQNATEGFFGRSLGGTLSHMVTTREEDAPRAEPLPGGGVNRIDRRAVFHNYLGARDLAITPAPNRAAAENPNSDQAIIDDLIIANRLMAGLGIITTDGSGHISARSRSNPNHFFIPADISPGIVTAADIIEVDLDTKRVNGPDVAQYSERFIHSEIYRARPDVMAVLHSHTPELRVFGQSSVKLRPVLNRALFIGDGLPVFDISKFNGGSAATTVDNPEEGRSLAQVLGNKPAALMLDHGIATTAPSLRALVSQANDLRLNARIQHMAILLRGAVNSFDQPAASPASTSHPEWDYWTHFVIGTTDLNSVPKPVSGLPIGAGNN